MSEEQEKQELIKRMGSKSNKVALAAVDELRKHGWLEDGSLRHMNLTGANLREADLKQAVIDNADFTRANLSDANLQAAILQGTILNEANLHNAYLFRANLIETRLYAANLTSTMLAYTNFSRAYLQSADFTDAGCFATVFGDVDLSTVKGLESVVHQGPSVIGLETLYKSKGNIPEIFLRGCGVTEDFITYIPSLTGRAIEFYSCFISYSHDDKAFARRVHDTLQGQGIRCWLDEKQMNPGDDIYHEIDRGIRYWDKVLLCCSRSALSEKWWVDHEIDKAFQKERDLMKDRKEKVLSLIPLDLDGFLFSKDCTNPKAQQIRSRIAADFKGWEKDNNIFEREIQRVVKALRTDGGKEQPPESRL